MGSSGDLEWLWRGRRELSECEREVQQQARGERRRRRQ
jgi:hypothetical protein